MAAVLLHAIWNRQWQALSFGLGCGLLWFLLMYPAAVRTSLLKATAPAAPRDTNFDDWPRLDRHAWDETARAWRELGFEPGVMWAVGTPKLGLSVVQLWESAERDSLVEISQSFVPRRTLPVTTAVLSFWGDAAALEAQAHMSQTPVAPIASPLPVLALPSAATNGAAPDAERLPIYSHSTHNRPPNWVWNFLLHPQILGTRMTGAAPEALWQTHLARRAAISQVLNQAPIAGDLSALAHAEHLVTHALWHRRFQHRFTRQMWRARLRGTQPTEYLGDLESRLREIQN